MTIKKFIMILVAFALVITMVSCGSNGGTTAEAGGNKTMEFVEKYGDFAIYRHTETGVCYLFINSGYGAGITVMLNSDGTPYTGGNEE